MSKHNKKWKKRNRKKKLRRIKKATENLNNSLTSEDETMKNTAMKQFSTYFKVREVNKSLGLVFGWGIICKKDGKPYVDYGNDHIPEEEMLEATFDFMKNSQVLDDMHDQEEHGTVVFSMPLTEEIAKAFEIQSDTFGWMVGVKPDSDIFEKFANGEYTGFSIGGVLEEYSEVDEMDEFYTEED